MPEHRALAPADPVPPSGSTEPQSKPDAGAVGRSVVIRIQRAQAAASARAARVTELTGRRSHRRVSARELRARPIRCEP